MLGLDFKPIGVPDIWRKCLSLKTNALRYKTNLRILLIYLSFGIGGSYELASKFASVSMATSYASFCGTDVNMLLMSMLASMMLFGSLSCSTFRMVSAVSLR